MFQVSDEEGLCVVSPTSCGINLLFCSRSFMQKYLYEKAPGYVTSYMKGWEHLQRLEDRGAKEGKVKMGSVSASTNVCVSKGAGHKKVVAVLPKEHSAGIWATWKLLHCQPQLSTAVLILFTCMSLKEAEDVCLGMPSASLLASNVFFFLKEERLWQPYLLKCWFRKSFLLLGVFCFIDINVAFSSLRCWWD